MIIHSQQLIAFLPFLILILTTLVAMVSIAYHRNHFFVAVTSILGLIFSFFSLYIVTYVSPIEITTLFYINNHSIFYMGLIILSSFSTCIFAYPWLIKSSCNKEEFYLLILFSTIGSIGLIISNHMSSLFMNIEIISVPIFALIAYSHYHKYSLEASLKYIILSGITSSFLLLGISWMYAISGNLNIFSIMQTLNELDSDAKLLVLFGFFMILLSFFFKLSIVPFHLWTADIYQGTPALVLSFFTNVSKISIMFILFHIFSYISFANNQILYFIISLLAFFSILFGNMIALLQNNIKRLFGYTSISQLGYLLIVLLILKNHYIYSLETVGVYLFSYFLSNIVFFGIISILSHPNKKYDRDLIREYQGLFWTHPFLAGSMTIALLSLSGIPLTLGFIGKFYILYIIIQEHLWYLGIAFIISTLLGIYCYLRIILIFYLKPIIKSSYHIDISRDSVMNFSKILIFISSIMLLILGFYPHLLINFIQRSLSY